jgi:hypothetical protein
MAAGSAAPHFSLAEAGLPGGPMPFSPLVMQPAVAGIFIATLGLASSYWMLLAMVALGGALDGRVHQRGDIGAGVRWGVDVPVE